MTRSKRQATRDKHNGAGLRFRGLGSVGGTCRTRAAAVLWRCLVVLGLVLSPFILPTREAVAQASVVAPPDVASYAIDAHYDPETHTIRATETLTYTNRTDAAIPDLVLHLYLNAFRSDETLWMREAGPAHRGYGYDANAPGWTRIDEISLPDGTGLSTAAVDADETLVRVDLPRPVGPGEALVVEMAFTAQLPKVFARTGWADGGEFVMAGQWFPKAGVWEQGAWNAHPFHANSEFYADFGAYDVALTLPEGWVVATTGVAVAEPVAVRDGTATQRFAAQHVIDFAWGASPHFRTQAARAGDVHVEVFHYPGARAAARRVMQATVDGLQLYGAWYGPYGGGLYPELTVILTPEDAGGAGGMEYPTLFTVGAMGSTFAPACFRMLEVETVHELAHQWFQSVIATNEVEAPWLDEGFAEYSTARAMDRLYEGAMSTCGGWTLSYLATRRLEYVLAPETPMTGTAWDLGDAWVTATYSKPVLALMTLERHVGEAAMGTFLATYAGRYAFTHPTEVDLRAVMAETLGDAVTTWFFEDIVESTATLDAQVVVAENGTGAIRLDRTGGLCVPVTVRAVDDGETVESEWPCDAADGVDLDETPAAVVIDPERDAVLDLNLANNGLRQTPDRAAWLGLIVRAIRVLQLVWGAGG